MENGARLYLDVGSHPEYATPECDKISDVVVHDKAGEWILAQLVTGAQARLREEGIRGEVYLFKNNTDSVGNSYGCHENYLTERNDEFNRYTEVLIPFLVSRQIYAGAGKVLQTARGAVFCLSQRAEHIWEGVSSATTRSRPIINTRDEPHADAERFRRLHVIVGDSNMSEYATFLKIGTTSHPAGHARGLLDRAARPHPGEPHPGHPRDQPRHHLPAPRAPGQRARDAGPGHPDRVPRAGAEVPRPPRPVARGGPGTRHVGALPQGPRGRPPSLYRECDWVAKYRIVEQMRARHDVSLSHPKVAMIDLMYHDVDRSRGLFYKLQQRDEMERTCTDDAITEAMTKPPETTRARLRGAFVKRAKERRRDFTVDWVHLKLNDQAQRTVLLKDPFKSHDERVERLIQRSDLLVSA